MHNHRVIHRDLKIGNIFIGENMEVKIGDFGLATKLDFDGEKKRTICGTPNYIAPEVLEGKSGHSYEVDIWSLGVILYTLIIGKPPFETSDVKTTYRRIRMNSYNFPDHVPISDAARDMIKRILVIDPKQRLTLDEVASHPFLNSNKVPTSLPKAFLAVPPTQQFVKEYMPEGLSCLNKQGSGFNTQKFDQSAPIKSLQRNGTTQALANPASNNMLFTDRNGMMNRKPMEQVPMSAKNERIH